ncbi:PP2C family protein-serine/threonine phosphatase [Actinophytocola sp.]|uniref:PP2C family protein-serine/threonine phosphatase n=1 Tax=Actinophytocola sp. TaxID=1872138 RepID=UPI002D808E73|nr:PP2C family protein-serine/threonine phosphatase [Actinophytocola sp.]HET9140375.1 PP2C family protein-serine/threonine phosphatase [Actinophytocola sp.]
MTASPFAGQPAREQSWDAALAEIINGAHVASADDLVDIIDGAMTRLGLSLQLYLVDLAQRQLNPVRPQAGPPLGVDDSLAGRAFRLVEIIPADAGQPGLWVPLVDGTERLGVVRVVLPARADLHDTEIRERCWVLAGLIGHLVAGKLPYSDRFHLVRRTRPMSVAAELLWQLLPPQTFACSHLVVAAVMEPYDRVGGDGYDYAVDADRAHLAVFDAVGHDVAAGLTTALALAATRNARRAGQGLYAAAAQADQVIAGQAGIRFVTALLADLDLTTGVLRYLNAGHPPPVLIRRGQMIKTLHSPVRPPLGLGHLSPTSPQVGSEQLEPGDRVLLHTDGITEARDLRGAEFGVDRLVDLAERHHRGGLPAPETLRRITHAVLDHQRGHLQDDATLLLAEWAPSAPAGLLPTF